MDKTRKNFDPQFRLDAAQLVVDQGYSIKEACESMGVSKSSMESWVRQLKQERQGQAPRGAAMTEEQRKIKELEKRIRQIEMEKEILKKATALLMSDSLNNFR
jgi:transposase